MLRTCPIDNSKIRFCNVTSCMYYSKMKESCGYSELHGCDSLEDIAQHKGITLKEANSELAVVKERAKYVILLDEYVCWIHDQYKNKIEFNCTRERILSVQELLKDSIISRLPGTVFVQLLKYIINQDCLDEFCDDKGIQVVLVADLLFDIDINVLISTLAEERPISQ